MKKGTKRRFFKSFVGAIAGICSLLLLVPMVFTSSGTSLTKSEIAENILSFVRIGIKYSNSAVSEYSFTTEYGLEYGIQNKDTHEFISLGKSDCNLWNVKNDSGYFVKVSYYIVGDKIYAKNDEIQTKLEELFPNSVEPVFIQYNSDGASDVRVGQFDTREEAQEYISSINERLDNINLNLPGEEIIYFAMSAVACDDSCLLLMENASDALCGYVQNNEMFSLAVRAVSPDDGSVGYICESGKIYDGVLEFRKIFKGSYIENIGVINVVDIEKYIAACMSYEIYPSWSHNFHKMFAIVVRTYVYGQIERHSSWDFNLCGNTHCQMYRGFDRVNTSLLTAAQETAGLVVADENGDLAHIYYSASVGGCNVSLGEVWGGAHYSYSTAVATPWEEYMSSKYTSRTKWKVEYSPYQLYLQIRDTCTELKGSIANIETTLATNSSHVQSITFMDIYGNTSTVKNTSSIAGLLGLNSANFVVGKAGTTVDRVVYSLDCFDSIYYENPDTLDDIVGFDGSDVYAVTSDGDILLNGKEHEIISSNGSVFGNIFDNRVQLVTGDENYWFTEDGLPDVLKAETVKQTIKVELTGEDGYFVFDGMGWGHGAGLSQYGSNDMIELGYSPETVLMYYLPGTKVVGINLI